VPVPDDEPPPEPIITIDSENGLCINAGNIGCSGTLESNIDWISWNISMTPYEWDQRWLSEQWWSDVSVGLTDLAYATSSVGAGIEATLTGLGAGGGTFGAVVGAITGNVIHQTFINPFETVFSSAATLSTIRADTLSGSLGFSTTGETVIVDVSDTTVTAVGSQAIGNINPIGVIDAMIDGYASSFSHGNAPGLLATVGLSNKTITIGPIMLRFGQ
jgi:hypothetical protein